jgi:hypothetical protein
MTIGPGGPGGAAQVPSGGTPNLPSGGTARLPSGDPVGLDPVRASVTVATYDNYPTAQRAVDHLSDSGFPVNRVSIVGTNLRLVERVLGRMTTGRSALAGAASGAWFGLLIGLLLSIFSVTGWWLAVLAGVFIGALWGAVFGAVAHAMTGGRRDFTSFSSLQASQYAVVVDAEHADEARALLVRLNWHEVTGPR